MSRAVVYAKGENLLDSVTRKPQEKSVNQHLPSVKPSTAVGQTPTAVWGSFGPGGASVVSHLRHCSGGFHIGVRCSVITTKRCWFTGNKSVTCHFDSL